MKIQDGAFGFRAAQKTAKIPPITMQSSFFTEVDLFSPIRHNREFIPVGLILPLLETGLQDICINFVKSRRRHKYLQEPRSITTAPKDLIPSFRKSLIGRNTK
jgi:hypothetical protein